MSSTAPETLRQTDYKAVMPSASHYDFIPMVHALTSRLLLDPTDGNALQLKEIVAAMAEIKQHIQRTRELIAALPEIGTSISSQRCEIERVHAIINKQRSQLDEISRTISGVGGSR